jgi:hypothetical protein
MRPNTLAEAIDRIRGGEPLEKAFPEFIDTFMFAEDADARYLCIEQEPALSGDVRLDALAGATAEYLAKLYRLPRVPKWAGGSSRRLAEPWFTTPSQAPEMHEYLAFASPAEFRSRNIFTDERPFRRARSHLPFAGMTPAPSDAA